VERRGSGKRELTPIEETRWVACAGQTNLVGKGARVGKGEWGEAGATQKFETTRELAMTRRDR